MTGPKTTIIIRIRFEAVEQDHGLRTRETEVMRLDLDEHADVRAAREFACMTASELPKTGYNGAHVTRANVITIDNWALESDLVTYA